MNLMTLYMQIYFTNHHKKILSSDTETCVTIVQYQFILHATRLKKQLFKVSTVVMNFHCLGKCRTNVMQTEYYSRSILVETKHRT